MLRFLSFLCLFLLSACASGFAPADTAGAPPQQPAGEYRLGVADKVRLLVFNEPTMSGEFSVGSNGMLSVPLIGDVKAVERTTSQISTEIQQRLADGYLRDPRVNVEVLSFRPFYILGEVNKPGEYPFATDLTVLNAVATAQGFTYRADKSRVFIKSPGEAAEREVPLNSATVVRPGDTIRIAERYF